MRIWATVNLSILEAEDRKPLKGECRQSLLEHDAMEPKSLEAARRSPLTPWVWALMLGACGGGGGGGDGGPVTTMSQPAPKTPGPTKPGASSSQFRITDIPDIQLDSRNDPALFGNQFFDSFKLKWIVQFTLEGPLSQPPKIKATSNNPVGFLVEYQGYKSQTTSNPDHVRHLYLVSFDLVNVAHLKDYVFDNHQVTFAFEDGKNAQEVHFVVEVGRDIRKSPMLDRSGQAVVGKKSLPEDSKLPFYGNETLTGDIPGSWHADKVTYQWLKYSSPTEFGISSIKYKPTRNGNEKDFIPDGPGRYNFT